jgi:hypothetical protein
MAIHDFKSFKEKFYSRVTDFSIFDAGDINLLKVVLDGLKVQYSQYGVFRTYLDAPMWTIKTYLFLKRTFNSVTKQKHSIDEYVKKLEEKKGKVIIVESGRVVKTTDGNYKSLYFQNISDQIGLQNLCIVADRTSKSAPADFNVVDIATLLESIPLNDKEWRCLNHLKIGFKKIKKAKKFSSRELRDIKLAFATFFQSYRAWLFTFTHIKPSKVIFVCHYHKEGLIYATKQLNIPSIELQHGLIANSDIFYIFPKTIESIRHRALFPDKILTYGDFWSEQLLQGGEFSPNQIQTFGYYLYSEQIEDEIDDLKKWLGDRKMILITTQTFMHEYFISYIQFLHQDILRLNLENEYAIVVKLHPAEKLVLYNEALKDELADIQVIQGFSLDDLMKMSIIHISIYSTTLFDAVRKGVKSYAIDYPAFSSYVREVVDSGVATKITPNQNPITFHDDLKKVTRQKCFFQEPKYELLF